MNLDALESISKNKKTEYRLYNSIPFILKDPLPESIDLDAALKSIEYKIPQTLFYYVDVVYVGQFDDFEEKNTNAKYEDGAIYLTNLQDDADDMIDDIVHELAHSVSLNNQEEIFSDFHIENEFLIKRKQLKRILLYHNYDVGLFDFNNIKYSSEFDALLYKEIGYPALRALTHHLFITPYAITSKEEYFATGFEEYYLRDRKFLYKVSPNLYKKINIINSLGEEI